MGQTLALELGLELEPRRLMLEHSGKLSSRARDTEGMRDREKERDKERMI